MANRVDDKLQMELISILLIIMYNSMTLIQITKS